MGHRPGVVVGGQAIGTQHGALVPCPDSALSLLADPQEPPWVEVLLEILLALLAQPSHLMRQVARSVFSHICSHLTPRALQLILDVSWGLWGNGSRDGALQALGCTRAASLPPCPDCNLQGGWGSPSKSPAVHADPGFAKS